MRKVILTVGPQGAGKSHLCQQIVAARPGIILISRDAILNELFGTVWLDPYTGAHLVAQEEMWRRLEAHLDQSDSATIILDAWNGFADERWEIASRLRSRDTDWIEAWRFVTPEDICVAWYLNRENKQSDDRRTRECRAAICRNNYRLYHEQPVEFDQGFDLIRAINPLQQTFWPYADLLLT